MKFTKAYHETIVVVVKDHTHTNKHKQAKACEDIFVAARCSSFVAAGTIGFVFFVLFGFVLFVSLYS